MYLPCEDGRNANRGTNCQPRQLTHLHHPRQQKKKKKKTASEIIVFHGEKSTGITALELTALVSVATARVTNIMLKVTMISMMSECQCGPVGVVQPSTEMGCSTALSTNDAQMAPVNCAAQ